MYSCWCATLAKLQNDDCRQGARCCHASCFRHVENRFELDVSRETSSALRCLVMMDCTVFQEYTEAAQRRVIHNLAYAAKLSTMTVIGA